MLPFTKGSIMKIELLHNFTFGKKGMEFFGLANYKYLARRLVIDANTKNNIEIQYQEFYVSKKFNSRIQLIEFGVDVPPILNKNYDSPIKILYAGRGGPQKRVWLIDEIAGYFINRKSQVQFQFAGPIENELSSAVKDCAIVYGSIGSKDRMYQIFKECHALLLTSAYEGFPMVIKEAMANGCVPIVTALPGNLTHLNFHNSLLIQEINNEKLLVGEAVSLIEKLMDNKLLLEDLSINAFVYATQHFQKEQFLQSYRSLLTTHR
jgi:glycosyltransferase involved in cell wall biosynthesis